MSAYISIRTVTRAALGAAGIFALLLPALTSALPALAASVSGDGTLAGTVTNANTGQPVPRATVTLAPGSLSTSTGADGGYSISVPAGDYSVTVSAFAYQLGVATVSIVSGQTTTRDFALEPSSSAATLRGRVLDQGHGYPLYAEVKIALNGNTVADTWNNPLNGRYRALLVTGNTYDVTVTPFIYGYYPGTATLTFNADTRRNFDLSPNYFCDAPGYTGTGNCQVIPGGLIEGGVADRNTGNALTGATLIDETGQSTQSSAVPGPVHNGFFIFEPAGTHTLTASYPGYRNERLQGSIANGRLRVLHYALRAGEFTLSPNPISVTAPVDASTPISLTIHNVGTAPGQWMLTSADAPAPMVPQNRPAVHRAWPPWRGVWNHPDTWDSPAPEGVEQRAGLARRAKTLSAASAAWTPIADYPIPIDESCAATDETTGLVYVVGGFTPNTNTTTAAGYVYNPRSGMWSGIADAPVAWSGQACAVVDGKFYMNDSRALYIYDPATDSWSRGADKTHSPYGAPAGVALDGKFYVIAGYVEAYDPASNGWTTLASYPSPDPQGDRSPSCGATEGKIYCAGGFYYNGSGLAVPIDYAYAYDPASNNWSPIASLPYAASGMAAGAGTGGKFLVSLGNISTFGPFSAPTDKGAVYDVASGTWSLLPDNLVTTAGAAGACGFYGFYTIGGEGDNYGITSAEVLPGRQVCGAGPAAYLSFAPAMGTLGRGQSATSVMTVDGTGQTAGTSSRAQVVLSGGPEPFVIVPLTIHWTAPSAPRKH